MASSLDESDQAAVEDLGARDATDEPRTASHGTVTRVVDHAAQTTRLRPLRLAS
jgi:hypothetical protein